MICLGEKKDEHLTWKPHIQAVSAKLKEANAKLSKIRHFIDEKNFSVALEKKLVKVT